MLVPYLEDEALIAAAANAAKTAFAQGRPWEDFESRQRVSNATYRLRKFSEWLRTEHRGAIAGRLADASLHEDIRRFKLSCERPLAVAGDLKLLRRHLDVPDRGNQAHRRTSQLVPYPEDAAMIEAAANTANEAIAAGRPSLFLGRRKRVDQATRHLRMFSEWLRREGKSPIADRLNDDSLTEDIQNFYHFYRSYSVDSGVRMLREHEIELQEFARELEQQLDDEPAAAASENTHQNSSLQSLFTELFGESPPPAEELQKFAANPEQQLDDESPPSEIPRSCKRLRGGSSDFNEVTSPKMHQAWAEVPEDFGHIVGLDWKHGPQLAPALLIAALNKRRVLPTLLQPGINLYIHGQPYTAQLQTGIAEGPPNNLLGMSIILIPRLKGG
ncbi:hypothetical protein [Bradyrhizobium sp. BWA-3-5]|uniref:hypothetical protein n=1 Tax=Bradyrhizobium sp. BWA-3-5 TaxID=3080013 RepID=UPI00293E95BE|nr:hypothetical protein [Bradyrhizobium sp. BWA-3-5]WOH63803.1 hypothetical protein RX331_24260 [Bradyrhizobium sp. BWA-3-5]